MDFYNLLKIIEPLGDPDKINIRQIHENSLCGIIHIKKTLQLWLSSGPLNGEMTLVGPKYDDQGPCKREAEGDLTAEEAVGV